MIIEYDKPVEVTESQYNKVIKVFAGLIAHRKTKEKFYIKYWGPFGKKELANYLQMTR